MQCINPISIKNPNARSASIRIQVPCGKCGSCRHNRRTDWSFRLKWELKQSITAIFLTLTYSDENLPENNTLVKKDLQNFFKRLRKENRKHSDKQIRYYAVGEYGTQTKRPHYHIILFNVSKQSEKKMEKLWTFGHSKIGQVTDASIHYTTKYHINTKNEKIEDKEKEFSLMSKRPPIGHNYLQKNSQWHIENDAFYVINNGFKQRLPRYYRDKIFPDRVDQNGEIHKNHQKTRHAEKIQDSTDINLNKEIDRLSRLGIQEPEKNIRKSLTIQDKKTIDKSQENNLF